MVDMKYCLCDNACLEAAVLHTRGGGETAGGAPGAARRSLAGRVHLLQLLADNKDDILVSRTPEMRGSPRIRESAVVRSSARARSL